jgi:cytochrome b561
MTKSYIIDRALHWISALLLLLMLMILSAQLHNVDWDIKGQLEHRQDAVEMHAIIGIILVLFTAARLLFPFFAKGPIKRVEPKSTRHTLCIKLTHMTLYACIFLLAGTGFLLINNYEIPLTVFGFDLAPDRDAFYSFFPKIHVVHMILKQSIWWLIAIHFIGIMVAKR